LKNQKSPKTETSCKLCFTIKSFAIPLFCSHSLSSKFSA
jgi:hypothetical protein